jgi:hypothetical protein
VRPVQGNPNQGIFLLNIFITKSIKLPIFQSSEMYNFFFKVSDDEIIMKP